MTEHQKLSIVADKGLEWKAKYESARAAGDKLLSCILSVRKHNTEEWMNGIAEDINAYAATTGESDRAHFDGDGLRITRAKLEPTP